MTIEQINARIKAIEELQLAFDARVTTIESDLLLAILENWEALRENLMPNFRKVWAAFEEQSYMPLIESYVQDMRTIVELNEKYFGESIPTVGLYERLGVTNTGKIIPDGYVSSIARDQTAKREVQQFLSRTKQLKFEQKVKADVKKLIKGEPAKPATTNTVATPAKPGVIKKFTDQNVVGTYNEADRVIQQDYADDSGLDAGMYTGGLIESSRPFCVARNRKVFIRSEIAKFGTSEDKFEGYSDKSKGLFNGKPKEGYDPFTQCGGYRCRHHWSWLANEYAVRVDKTLELVDGKLKRKE